VRTREILKRVTVLDGFPYLWNPGYASLYLMVEAHDGDSADEPCCKSIRSLCESPRVRSVAHGNVPRTRSEDVVERSRVDSLPTVQLFACILCLQDCRVVIVVPAAWPWGKSVNCELIVWDPSM